MAFYSHVDRLKLTCAFVLACLAWKIFLGCFYIYFSTWDVDHWRCVCNNRPYFPCNIWEPPHSHVWITLMLLIYLQEHNMPFMKCGPVWHNFTETHIRKVCVQNPPNNLPFPESMHPFLPWLMKQSQIKPNVHGPTVNIFTAYIIATQSDKKYNKIIN